jgi:hypothetical protein
MLSVGTIVTSAMKSVKSKLTKSELEAKLAEALAEVERVKERACRKTGMSPEEFEEHAEPVDLLFGDHQLRAEPRKFSTGSYGWRVANTPITMMVNGVELTARFSGNVIVVGSKPK